MKENITIYSKDLSAAAEFYQHKLGRRVLVEEEQLLLPQEQIIIRKGEPQARQLRLKLRSLEQTARRLQLEPGTVDGRPALELSDPDGNQLILLQDELADLLQALADGWSGQQLAAAGAEPAQLREAQLRLSGLWQDSAAAVKEEDPAFIEEVRGIEQLVYPPNLVCSHAAMLERWKKVADSFIFLRQGQQLMAYINLFPMSEQLAQSVLEDDTIHDDDITAAQLEDYCPGRGHHLYLLSVAMRPELQGSDAVIALTGALSAFLRRQEERGCRIDSISATTVSDAGRRTASRLGLQAWRTINEGYVVYHADRAAVLQLMYRSRPGSHGKRK